MGIWRNISYDVGNALKPVHEQLMGLLDDDSLEDGAREAAVIVAMIEAARIGAERGVRNAMEALRLDLAVRGIDAAPTFTVTMSNPLTLDDLA